MRTHLLGLLLCVYTPLGVRAQITFEQEYQVVDSLGSGPLVVKIAADEHKYLVADYSAGTFSLYNLDHTPFITNISAPVPLYQSPNWYQPCLVSRSLFDCDSTTIEFAVASVHVDDADQFLIVSTTGVVLFSEVNATFPYCYGCAVGTRVDKGVFSTEEGTKMMLMLWDGVPGERRFRVYEVCGELSEGMSELPPVAEASLFPNPGDGIVTLMLPPEAPTGTHQVKILNSLGEIVGSFSFQGPGTTFDPSAFQLSAGNYDLLIVGRHLSFHSRLLVQ